MSDFDFPISSGSERTSKRLAMKGMFDVVNPVLEIPKSGQDWHRCWCAVYSLQNARRNYIKLKLMDEMVEYDIINWSKAILENEVVYYTEVNTY